MPPKRGPARRPAAPRAKRKNNKGHRRKIEAAFLARAASLKYLNSIADAVADPGKHEEINCGFVGFQKYLYQREPYQPSAT
jgi:hypothetical protein